MRPKTLVCRRANRFKEVRRSDVDSTEVEGLRFEMSLAATRFVKADSIVARRGSRLRSSTGRPTRGGGIGAIECCAREAPRPLFLYPTLCIRTWKNGFETEGIASLEVARTCDPRLPCLFGWLLRQAGGGGAFRLALSKIKSKKAQRATTNSIDAAKGNGNWEEQQMSGSAAAHHADATALAEADRKAGVAGGTARWLLHDPCTGCELGIDLLASRFHRSANKILPARFNFKMASVLMFCQFPSLRSAGTSRWYLTQPLECRSAIDSSGQKPGDRNNRQRRNP
jgi:hypothetical protein